MPTRTDIVCPSTSDGKLIFLNNLFPGGVLSNFTGRGDNITAGTKWNGERFVINTSESGYQTVAWQFLKWVYLAGGLIRWKGADIDDWVNFRIYAPATAGEANGSGTGAYTKYQIGIGKYIFVPHPTQQGDWDLDLEETLNPNVDFTKVVPVPATVDEEDEGTGWFDWDSSTGAVTLNSEQKGSYHLLDHEQNIAVFMNEINLLGDCHDDFIVPAVKPKKILPHWKFEVKTYNASAKSLKVTWNMYLAREDTT